MEIPNVTESLRSRLIKAALDCFLADDYHNVTTRRIAESAGANVSMIRYYFGSKEGLYEEMIRETLSPLLDVLDGPLLSSTAGFAEFLVLYYKTMSARPEFPKLILKVLALHHGPGRRFIQQLLERGRTRGARKVADLKAQGQMGVMYLRGEGGPANPQAAFDYTKKSAEAGYPAGQFNLYIHLWNGEVVDKNRTEALVWLNRSADQNQAEALLALAALIEEGQVPDRSLVDAEELFSRCMNAANANKSLRVEAAFHYARLLSYQINRLQSLTTAADILQHCYEEEECLGEIADACVELSKSTIGQIRKLVVNRQGTAEEISAAEMVANYFFDSTGNPISKRSHGLDKLEQTMREMSEARKHLSPELYERRLLEKMTPTLHAQIKREKALRVVSTARIKIGRNDPCPCNSGKKLKHCCGNN
jgi:AcrR family transcriptional regulator